MKHPISSKKSYENNPELRKLRSEIFSKNLKGRKYVNKDGVVKRVHKENLENYLSSG